MAEGRRESLPLRPMPRFGEDPALIMIWFFPAELRCLCAKGSMALDGKGVKEGEGGCPPCQEMGNAALTMCRYS